MVDHVRSVELGVLRTLYGGLCAFAGPTQQPVIMDKAKSCYASLGVFYINHRGIRVHAVRPVSPLLISVFTLCSRVLFRDFSSVAVSVCRSFSFVIV